MASSHPAWSYWSDATVLDDYAMTTTTTTTTIKYQLRYTRMSVAGRSIGVTDRESADFAAVSAFFITRDSHVTCFHHFHHEYLFLPTRTPVTLTNVL